MEKDLGSQAVSLILFFAAGYVLGPLYDSLRLIRERGGLLFNLLGDGIFCAAVGLGLFCLAMREENGALGTWECAFFALGFAVYCLSLSPALTRLLFRLKKKCTAMRDSLKNYLILYREKLKKYFQKFRQ